MNIEHYVAVCPQTSGDNHFSVTATNSLNSVFAYPRTAATNPQASVTLYF